MKRTLTAFTAAIFATAIAIPAFAQMSGEASTSTSNSASSESVKHEYQAVQPAPVAKTVESSEHDYHSESSKQDADPSAPREVQSNSDSKVTSSTTRQVTPPPVVEESTTTRRENSQSSESNMQ